MQRTIQNTADGSKTLFIPALAEGYHSHHGALQEARHVFIENGLMLCTGNPITILELGFGTGLNAMVTAEMLFNTEKKIKINYFGVEKYPVTRQEISLLNYPGLFPDAYFKDFFEKIHDAEWDTPEAISENFNLKKIRADFYEIRNIGLPPVDMVYFDCFGARVQPDLWEEPLLHIVADTMKSGGIFATYSSKGSLRRSLKNMGFEVFKKPGPPGKREMLTAIKN